ncbi:MAG: peptide-methionine (S)-S-oxide reductase [Candidatus Thermoplasmatota archaeon]
MEREISYGRLILGFIVAALLISAVFVIYEPDNLEEEKDLVTDEIPEIDRNTQEDYSTATFGVGCFWGPEARLGVVDGVIRTRVGYLEINGSILDDSGSKREAVQADYDPERLSYEYLYDLISEMGEIEEYNQSAEFSLADRYQQHYRIGQHEELSKGFRRTYPEVGNFVNSTAASKINGYLTGYSHLDSREDLKGFGLTEEGMEEVYYLWNIRLRGCCF